MSDPDEIVTPCRRWSAYLRVQGRRWGLEVEWRKHPRHMEGRVLTPRRTKVVSYG